MKHRPWMRVGAIAGLSLAVLGIAPLTAVPPSDSMAPFTQDLDRDTRFDVNAIEMWVTNHGSFAYDIETGNSGLVYPRGGQNTAVFAGGLWVGGMVGSDLRVIVNEYSWECGPGPIDANGDFPPGADDDPTLRTYKIDRGDDATSNPDYAEWPAGDGAPVDENGDPLILGDQTLWSVYNDADQDRHTNDAGRTRAMGLEIQQTTFGFSLQGPLEHVCFVKFLFINKGTDTIEDTYVSLWSDPDVGGFSDDLVGCDTLLSLGYSYNATNNDNQYGSRPPAIGFDFLQGPIVPSVGDTAYVSGEPRPGFRNLPMASFNKYINGTDPATAQETYNFMRGVDGPSGDAIVDPSTGAETKFFHAGDPITGEGWLDDNPADRRLMLSAGPFTMAPQDTQEVVAAVVLGQARDRLTSITRMKYHDRFAQAAFDLQFDLPDPPPAPDVHLAEVDGVVTLNWDDRSETEYEEEGYEFEGYNVYQLASPDATAERRLLATYDLVNGIALIFDEVFDEESGVVLRKPVQFGTDSGIARTIKLSDDAMNGGGLRNGSEYYYLVTAYSYDPEGVPGLKTLESRFIPHTAIPQAEAAGIRYDDGTPGDVLDVVHEGLSDGEVIPTVVDPTITTGETYEVTFRFVEECHVEDHDGKLDTVCVNVPLWDLKTTGGRDVLTAQRNMTGDNAYLVADGILWQVIGALPGWKRNDGGNMMIDEVLATGGVPVEPDGNGGPGNHVWHSYNAAREWIMSAGGGNGGEGRFTRDGDTSANLTSSDIVLRFDGHEDNMGWWGFDDNTAAQIPFGLYLVDPATGEETRLIAFFFSGGVAPPGSYAISADSPDGWQGWPATAWCYAYTVNPNDSYAEFLADARDNGVIDEDARFADTEMFSRMVFAVPDAADPLPGMGTEISFNTTKPVTDTEKFIIDTKGVSYDQARLQGDLKDVRVVPNPYTNQSTYELSQFNRRVKFTNVPEECSVRIFTISGDLVRKLDKEYGPSSIIEWDLTTENNLPVASGVYIYHIEAKKDGKVMESSTGRLAVFMEKERLNFF